MKVVKNIFIVIVIIGLLGVIGYCGYRIYDRLNGNKTEPAKTEENKKEEKVVTTDNKNADINKSVLVNLYDNDVIKTMNIREVIESEINFTLDYGNINNHNVKIKIYVHNTGNSENNGPNKYQQSFDVYVDENKYTLFDMEGAYIYSNGIGELFENIEIKTNKMGIIFMSNIKSNTPDQATAPFILIYNNSNKFEFISEKITNKFVRMANSNGFYDKNIEELKPINVLDDSVKYCKYDGDNDSCSGKAKVTCVEYNGEAETISEQFDAYIHEQLC